MATIIWPANTRGTSRPYGYWEQQTQTGAGSKVIGVHADVHKIGMQVKVSSAGSYFAEGTLDSPAQIAADTATWFDLYGDGSTAQTASIQFQLDGPLTAVRVRVVSGTMVLTVDERRV
jgi:hypothetical protein